MRVAMMVAAAVAAVGLGAPTEAKVFYVTYSAYVSGTQSIITCPMGQSMNCPLVESPFSTTINRILGPIDLAPGPNAFTDGSVYTTGLITGTINREGDYLYGFNLNYGRSICGAGNNNPGCGIEMGTASTFAVGGGIPEPATWGLLALGFGTVGYTMRRRRQAIAFGSRKSA